MKRKLADTGIKALKPRVATQAAALLRAKKAPGTGFQPLFPSRSNLTVSMSYEGLREAVARTAEAAAIEAAPHEVRSTFSTWANGRGEEARVIELCLGHGERNQVDAATTTPSGCRPGRC